MKLSLLWKRILAKIEKYGFKLKKDLPVPETIEELNSVLQQHYILIPSSRTVFLRIIRHMSPTCGLASRTTQPLG
jgi:hypothetical protein